LRGIAEDCIADFGKELPPFGLFELNQSLDECDDRQNRHFSCGASAGHHDQNQIWHLSGDIISAEVDGYSKYAQIRAAVKERAQRSISAL
jgi:hypothetical protein